MTIMSYLCFQNALSARKLCFKPDTYCLSKQKAMTFEIVHYSSLTTSSSVLHSGLGFRAVDVLIAGCQFFLNRGGTSAIYLAPYLAHYVF